MPLEAIHLRGRRWAVRPVGVCGTCGWINGEPWTVFYVTANSAFAAVRYAERRNAYRKVH